MSTARAYMSAALAFLKRDTLVFFSYRTIVVTQLIGIVLQITMFYFISRLVRVEPFNGPDEYYAFVVAGLLILGIVTSTVTAAAGSMRQELVAGTFERMVLSPFGAVGSVAAMMLFPFVVTLVISTITLILATIIFGLPLSWDTAWLAIPAAFLGAFAFAPFGMIIAGATVVAKQAMSAAAFLLAIISIVAGFYFPVSLLPDWIEWMSDVQPFTPAVDLLRHVLIDTPLKGSAWLDVVKLLGFGVVLTIPSLWILQNAVRLAQRRGTIIEY